MTTPTIDLNPPDLFHVKVRLRNDPAVTSWSPIDWVDPEQCSCKTLDGSATVCVSCAESCGWDYHIWWPQPVQVTPETVNLLRVRRESLGLTWVQLAALVGAPLGTISSLGYAPQRLTARVFRGLAHALELTTQELLDGIGG